MPRVRPGYGILRLPVHHTSVCRDYLGGRHCGWRGNLDGGRAGRKLCVTDRRDGRSAYVRGIPSRYHPWTDPRARPARSVQGAKSSIDNLTRETIRPAGLHSAKRGRKTSPLRRFSALPVPGIGGTLIHVIVGGAQGLHPDDHAMVSALVAVPREPAKDRPNERIDRQSIKQGPHVEGPPAIHIGANLCNGQEEAERDDAL